MYLFKLFICVWNSFHLFSTIKLCEICIQLCIYDCRGAQTIQTSSTKIPAKHCGLKAGIIHLGWNHSLLYWIQGWNRCMIKVLACMWTSCLPIVLGLISCLSCPKPPRTYYFLFIISPEIVLRYSFEFLGYILTAWICMLLLLNYLI